MGTPKEQENQPPKLRHGENGAIDNISLADLLEWFLNFDERTARMRHTNTEELFQWKQKDDAANGIATYPFESAEARFAIGASQALAANNTETSLNDWISDILNALQEAQKTKNEIAAAYGLDADLDASAIERSKKLTTNAEKRLYLTSCWIEALCTAEARFLGWVYQDVYGTPYAP